MDLHRKTLTLLQSEKSGITECPGAQ